MKCKTLTYVSLFSSAGIGCFGLSSNGFNCVITNEILEKRLNIQRYNKKCKYDSGYICGDITQNNIKSMVLKEIEVYKEKESIDSIDVVIATPPCQGMSVANHKKNDLEITRNSLVVEAIEMVEIIQPKFFIFENVQAFMKTICFDNGIKKQISKSIEERLGKYYDYSWEVINFKSYGANSSRTRTLVIGVRKDLNNSISPIDFFPDYEPEKQLNKLIFKLPRFVEMGEIDPDDIYHNFKPYAKNMREWISGIPEGSSAYDNIDIKKIPHKVVNGELIPNVNKNGDKYKRQCWSKVAPCIHTRNDILSSQNTIHPEDDRVFSIRELMILMNIPKKFTWSNHCEPFLNSLSTIEKRLFLKKNELNIRQSIGEAIPTIIIDKIAANIKKYLMEISPSDKDIQKIIKECNLSDISNLKKFIETNKLHYSFNGLSKLAEISNSIRVKTGAYYTDKHILTIIFNNLPFIEKEQIHILEPSVGVGNFIPILIKKYSYCKSLIIDVIDIDSKSLEILEILLHKINIPSNVKINIINHDFILYKINIHYDLIVGNPPFLKLRNKDQLVSYQQITQDNIANNSAAFFLEKSYSFSDNVAMILPKYFLHNNDFSLAREITSNYEINKIIDFGESGFKGVLIETICVFVSIKSKRKNNIVECTSLSRNESNLISQLELCDPKYPNWLLYRNKFFNDISDKMTFRIFKCYRDRQITNEILNGQSGVWVIKSRNIINDGSGIEHIAGYDSFVIETKLHSLSISKYYGLDNVFLCPNMTYYPRVVKKPKNTIVNGSVAIFELNQDQNITSEELKYFSSSEFREFYSIARNYSTRSLNLDKNSIFYFGKKHKGD